MRLLLLAVATIVGLGHGIVAQAQERTAQALHDGAQLASEGGEFREALRLGFEAIAVSGRDTDYTSEKTGRLLVALMRYAVAGEDWDVARRAVSVMADAFDQAARRSSEIEDLIEWLGSSLDAEDGQYSLELLESLEAEWATFVKTSPWPLASMQAQFGEALAWLALELGYPESAAAINSRSLSQAEESSELQPEACYGSTVVGLIEAPETYIDGRYLPSAREVLGGLLQQRADIESQVTVSPDDAPEALLREMVRMRLWEGVSSTFALFDDLRSDAGFPSALRAELHLQYGCALFDDYSHAEAIKAFAKAAELAISAGAIGPRLQFSAAFWTGIAHLLLGNPEVAVRSLETAGEVLSSHPADRHFAAGAVALVHVLGEIERGQQAGKVLDEVAAVVESSGAGAGLFDTAAVTLDLALALSDAGHTMAAATLVKGLVDRPEVLPGVRQEAFARAIDLDLALGDAQSAAETARKLTDFARTQYGSESREAAIALSRWAEAADSLGRISDAEKLHAEAQNVIEYSASQGDDVAGILLRYANHFLLKEDFATARSVVDEAMQALVLFPSPEMEDRGRLITDRIELAMRQKAARRVLLTARRHNGLLDQMDRLEDIQRSGFAKTDDLLNLLAAYVDLLAFEAHTDLGSEVYLRASRLVGSLDERALVDDGAMQLAAARAILYMTGGVYPYAMEWSARAERDDDSGQVSLLLSMIHQDAFAEAASFQAGPFHIRSFEATREVPNSELLWPAVHYVAEPEGADALPHRLLTFSLMRKGSSGGERYYLFVRSLNRERMLTFFGPRRPSPDEIYSWIDRTIEAGSPEEAKP